MSVPLPPESGSFPRRPRPAPEVPAVNGAGPSLPPMSAADQRVIAAIEEYAMARRALGLPPGRFTQEEGPELDDEAQAAEHRVAAYAADIDAAVWGAFPEAIEDLTPPANPDAFLVGGFIRPGTTVMLTGPPGSAKSWAARQLAMAAAAGLESFLGTYALERPLNVLVVDEDNGPDEEWRRDQTLLAHLEVGPPQLQRRLKRVSLRGVQLDQEFWQHWLRGLIRLEQIDLVILDPISEMHGGKELREDPAFRSMLTFLKRLKVDFPALASLLVHHTRKVMPGTPVASRGLDDVRGQWGQTPDVVALMWPLAERRVAWELHKRVPHSKLILEALEHGPLVKLADETTTRSLRMETDDKVLNAIEGGLNRAVDIVTGTGLSKSAVFKALARLAEVGMVTKRAPYQLLEGD